MPDTILNPTITLAGQTRSLADGVSIPVGALTTIAATLSERGKLTVHVRPKGLGSTGWAWTANTTDARVEKAFAFPVGPAVIVLEHRKPDGSGAVGSESYTVNVVDAVVGSKPERRVIRGTIVETEAARQASRDAGFAAQRQWLSVNWQTGQINDVKDAPLCDRLAKAGDVVIGTITPDESRVGPGCRDFGIVADQVIAADPDKSIIWQIVNEANHPPYWNDGNVLKATERFAVPIATKLKAAGYKVAAPSITWGDPVQIGKWVAQIMSVSPAGLWDYLDGHLYADLNQFRKTFAAWRALADQYGTKLMSSEWSYKVGNDKFAPLLPKFVEVMDAYCDIHCHFSFTYGAKFNPFNSYCWRDGKTTVVYDAWRKVNGK